MTLVDRSTVTAATPPDVTGLPAGVQPEENGRLLCRCCGRWYRSLGHHLRGGHDITPDEYRHHFELPASLRLMAGDLRDAQGQRGRQILESNPRVRDAFGVGEHDRPERLITLAKARKVKQQTESRAGVQASKQAVGALLAQVSQQRAAQRRAELDTDAHSRGYRDFQHLLTETAHLTHEALDKMIGWGSGNAAKWRRKYHIAAGARAAAAQRRQEQQRAGLADLPPGVQPVDDGKLRCLECGRWWADLAQHLTGTHHLDASTYRQRHGIPADCPLMAPHLLERQGHRRGPMPPTPDAPHGDAGDMS